MLKNMFFGFILAAVLSSCSPYTYDAKLSKEAPATIQYTIGTEWKHNFILDDELLAPPAKGQSSVTVHTINGTLVRNRKSNPEISGNRVFLTPGPTKFAFNAVHDGISGTIHGEFHVKSGEHYIPSINPKSVIIKNKNGDVVSEIPFSVQTRSVSHPIYIPKFK